MNERLYSAPSGIPALIGIIVLLLADGAWLVNSIQNKLVWGVIAAVLFGIVLLISLPFAGEAMSGLMTNIAQRIAQY